MRVNKTPVFLFAFIGLTFISACNRNKTALPDSTLKELQTQVESSLVKKLSEQPDFAKVNEVTVLETVADPEKGVVTMKYRVSYESESIKEGHVTHGSEAKVTLVRKTERDWTLTSTEATSQELVFQDDVVLPEEKPE